MKVFKITTCFNDTTQKHPLTVGNEAHQKSPSNHLARQTSITGWPRCSSQPPCTRAAPGTFQQLMFSSTTSALLISMCCPPFYISSRKTKNTDTQFSLLT